MVPSFPCGVDNVRCSDVLLRNGTGAIVIRACFDARLMGRLAKLLTEEAQESASSHSLRSGTRVLPCALEYICSRDPELAIQILCNPTLNSALDNAVGHAVLGSLAGHTFLPGRQQQQMHNNSLGHIYNGKFWKANSRECKRQTTPHILPCAAVQVLIAACTIGYSNGGTLLVESLHKRDIDLLVPEWQQKSTLVCPELKVGDVLLFHHSIAQCGGGRTTDTPRAALIGQWTSSSGML
jgi:hypothetical protein